MHRGLQTCETCKPLFSIENAGLRVSQVCKPVENLQTYRRRRGVGLQVLQVCKPVENLQTCRWVRGRGGEGCLQYEWAVTVSDIVKIVMEALDTMP